MSMFDHHSPDYSADRIYEAADRLVKQAKENPPQRFPCALGCGADFLTMTERELHLLTDHERDES